MCETSLALSAEFFVFVFLFQFFLILTSHTVWCVAKPPKYILTWAFEHLLVWLNEKTSNAELILVLFQMFRLSKQKLMSFNGNTNPHGDQDEKDTLENTV